MTAFAPLRAWAAPTANSALPRPCAGSVGRWGQWIALAMPRRTAYASALTLVELLLVVAGVCVLIAVLVPALNRARTQALRETCRTQMHQLDLAARMYYQDNGDRWPAASMYPSIGPSPLEGSPVFIADLVAPYVGGDTKVFRCRGDVPWVTDRLPPNTGKSYFETERSSYYCLSAGGMWSEYAPFHDPRAGKPARVP